MKTSESYLPEGSYMVQPAVRQAFSTLGARDCFSAPVAGVLTAAGQGVEHGRFADVRVARQRHGAPHGCTSI